MRILIAGVTRFGDSQGGAKGIVLDDANELRDRRCEV
jgi:hypothetical protein